MQERIPVVENIAQVPRYDLAVCMLASGSKGNSVFVTDGTTSILLDAGLSGVEIERRLKQRGISPDSLDAIVVSHEHTDHIQGVGVLSRRHRLPVYISRKTARAAAGTMGRAFEVRHFECGMHFVVASLVLHPFSISHDAADPAGFTIRHDGTKIGVATDLGFGTAMVKRHLADCDLLVLEANHDPEMLINGPYPWPLKQRIQGRTGHLSNPEAKRLLAEILHPRLRQVILAHLSETNNCPELALKTVREAVNGFSIGCAVAAQDTGSGIFFLQS